MDGQIKQAPGKALPGLNKTVRAEQINLFAQNVELAKCLADILERFKSCIEGGAHIDGDLEAVARAELLIKIAEAK